MTAVGAHSGTLRQAVLLLKYHQKAQLAEPLGAALADRLLKAGQSPYPEAVLPVDLVIPVPLSSARFRTRGYNQAGLIAGVVAERLGIPANYSALVRTRATPTQTDLTHERRAENVKEAFALREGTDLKGKTVLVIDDVITTASTIRECARVLQQAGAKTVYVAAITHEA